MDHGEGVKVDYIVPNRIARGQLLNFEVSLRRQQELGWPGVPPDEFVDTDTTYAIALASGGYVSGIDTLDMFDPSDPTFSEQIFYDDALTSTVFNSPLAPVIGDPVETVTGNIYHDETDLRIKGRGGLDYVFSRTYNSSPSAANARARRWAGAGRIPTTRG